MPAAFNLGSLSSLANGVYEPGAIPGVAGVPGAGFGPTNLACAFNDSSCIDVPGSSLQFTGPLSLIAWVKSPPGSDLTQSVASLGTNACRLTLDPAGYPHFSDGMQSFGDLIAAIQVNDNQWHQLAGIFDGANEESLYVDGLLAADSTGATAAPLATGEGFWIGGDPVPGTFQFFNGVIDEVAVFTNALTATQLLWLYSTASHALVLSAPKYSHSSKSVDLTWSTVPGLNFQLLEATNLDQKNWTVLSTNLTPTNSAITISLPSGSAAQRFYRILMSP